MLGKTVLWLPGFDHAGISTQSVIEKMLWKNEQKTRHDLGREEFLRRAWIWKDEYVKTFLPLSLLYAVTPITNQP